MKLGGCCLGRAPRGEGARQARTGRQGFSAKLRDPVLADLLEEAWTCDDTDLDRLQALCDQCVARAQRQPDPAARFWAYLSRCVLTHEHRGGTETERDHERAREQLSAVADRRGLRLFKIAEAAVLRMKGRHEQALHLYGGLSRQTPMADDDFFMMRGWSRCAERLGDLDAQFCALQGNVMLTQARAPSARHARASADLAEGLLRAGLARQAMPYLKCEADAAGTGRSHRCENVRRRCLAAMALYSQGQLLDAKSAFQDLAAASRARLAGRLAFDFHTGLAGVSIALRDWDLASASLEAARTLARAAGRPALTGVCHEIAALVADATGRHAESIHELESALSCYEADQPLMAPLHMHADAGELLVRRLAEQGEAQRALTAQRRFFQLGQSRLEYRHRAELAFFRARHSAVRWTPLTERELQCLSWSAEGKTAWETGQILNLSEWTVVYHLEKVKRKLGFRRKHEAIAHAIELGIVPRRGEHGLKD